MFHWIVLLVISAVGAGAMVLPFRDWLKTGNRKNWGIIVLLVSMNAVNVISYLSLILHGKMFPIGLTTPPLAFLNVVAWSSLVFASPFAIHTMFPARESGKLSLMFFFIFIGFVAFNLSGLMPQIPPMSVGFFSVILGQACYSMLYYLVATTRYRHSPVFRSREGWYGFAGSVVVILSIPFMAIADFTTIPMGMLPSRFSMVRWHVLAMNISCLAVALLNKPWLNEEPHRPGSEITEGERLKAKALAWGLSLREQEVLPLLLENLSYKVIAEQLCISIPTVKSHAISIYQKSGASGRGDLARILRG
jgi:DNA-binding CsgD family transcriptional regulator